MYHLAPFSHKKSLRLIVKAMKSVTGASCVNQLSSIQPVTIIHTLALNLPVGAILHQFWTGPRVIRILNQGYILPFQNQSTLTKSVLIKWLCTSPQDRLPDGGITCTYAEISNRKGQKSNISGYLKQNFLGSKAQQQVETCPRSQLTGQFSEVKKNSNWKHQKV